VPADFTQLLTTALTIVSIATLAGLGLLRGTVSNLREQLRDERENGASLRTKLTDVETDNARLRADLSALQRVVTGEVHWVALGEQTQAHHDAAVAHWQQDEQILREIRDSMRQLQTQLSRGGP
jgi:chromosome segregation ATPase